MTLARQLIIPISLIFLAVLLGVEAIHLKGARSHLQDQLESHAQDAATSLGLSLGILLGRGDDAVAETVINAAFDRGHYERIEFINVEGRTVVSKVLLPQQTEAAYPQWFADIFPLTGPTAESLVSTGWNQRGKVRVTSHPRFAYEQLWNTARNTLVWLSLIYVVALLFLRLFLRSVLRPLKAIESAAQAIAQRDFVTVDEIPETRELRQVVTAMNSLSGKVRMALEIETARAADLQEVAYFDPVSTLLNRRGLTARFNSRFRDEKESFAGTLALLQISSLVQVNEAHGQQKGDELVGSVGKVITDIWHGDGLAGRWAGALFVLVVPAGEREQAELQLREAQLKAASVVAGMGLDSIGVEIHIGAVYTQAAAPELQILVEAAEEALQQAVDKRADLPELRVLSVSNRDAGHRELIEVVRLAIASGRVELAGQPAMAMTDGKILHVEIMGRLLDDDGRQLPAAEFIPLVARHDLSGAFDQAIVHKVIEAARPIKVKQTLAINLAAQSIADTGFQSWLGNVLKNEVPAHVRLVFEVSEHGVLQNEAAAMQFALLVSRLGAGLAIDHFGVHRESLALVRRLNPVYVKLSAVHTPRIATDMGTRFFIESVVLAAKQLDVPVIAQSVEDAASVEILRSLGLAGYQGYVAGKPATWPTVSG